MTTLRNLEPAEHTAETVSPKPVKAYHAVLYARRKFKDQVQPDEPDPTTVSQIIAMKAHLQDLSDVTIERIYMDCQKMDSHQSLPQLQQLLLDIENRPDIFDEKKRKSVLDTVWMALKAMRPFVESQNWLDMTSNEQ